MLNVTKNRLWGYVGQFDVWYSDESRRTSEVQEDFYKNYLGDKEDEWQQADSIPDEIPF